MLHLVPSSGAILRRKRIDKVQVRLRNPSFGDSAEPAHSRTSQYRRHPTMLIGDVVLLVSVRVPFQGEDQSSAVYVITQVYSRQTVPAIRHTGALTGLTPKA